MKKFSSGILVAVAAVAIAVVPAGAVDDTKPEVTCAGAFATDAPGDTTGPANTEVKQGFFKYGADGEVTANIQVANLDKSVADNSSGTNWYVVWEAADGAIQYVSAALDSAGAVTYDFGTLANNVFSPEGTTSGAFFEGPDGVIQIVIPAAFGGTDGTELKSPYVEVFVSTSLVVVSSLATADRAPDGDGQGGASYTVAPCPASAAPVAPGATTTPAAALGVRVSPSKVSAKKSRKGKKLTFTLKSADTLTKLSMRLSQGKKVIATGSLSKLSGTRRATLKVKSKPKTGSATLRITATDASGAKRQGSFRIKVTK